MPLDPQAIIQRIDAVKAGIGHKEQLVAAYAGTLSVLRTVYGPESPQERLLTEQGERVFRYDDLALAHDLLSPQILGLLEAARADTASGFLGNQVLRISGEVLGDLLTLAKLAADEGQKDVAGVLAAASLEDTMKRFARQHQLNVEGKDLRTVVETLGQKQLLTGPALSVAKGHLDLRDYALHANWGKVDAIAVRSLIAYLEEFLLRNFQ